MSSIGTVYRLDRTAFKNFKFDFEFSEFSATRQGETFFAVSAKTKGGTEKPRVLLDSERQIGSETIL